MKSINNIAVLGNFWGDEGKARTIHHISLQGNHKFLFRQSGSQNAGHTIYHNGMKIVRNALPSVDFSNPNNFAFLGSDMVLHPESLLLELQRNESQFPGSSKNIIIDPDMFVITDLHLEEDKANKILYGSTGKGVSCAYRDKIYRKGTKLLSLIKDNSDRKSVV